MRKTSLVLFVALLSIAVVGARVRSQPPAPRDDEREDAKAQLQVLEKLLPDIMAGWLKDRSHLDKNYVAKLRVVRRTSPTTAKVTFLLKYHDANQPEAKKPDELVSIFMSYCDKEWTATSVKGTCDLQGRDQFLMLAIDEGGIK